MEMPSSTNTTMGNDNELNTKNNYGDETTLNRKEFNEKENLDANKDINAEDNYGHSGIPTEKNKYAKTIINNIEWQLANHELGNFVQANKEIVFLKDKNDKFCVSLAARGLYFTLMCLYGINWHLTQAGLATLCCCTTKKIQNYIDELTELGYLKDLRNSRDKGKFTGFTYKVFETINPELWVTETNKKTGKKPYVKKAHVTKADVKKAKQYNNKKNKYTKDKINKNNTLLLNKFMGNS